ncbi:hypothetical protein F5X68DRAFT_209572 [Plectosphaerella plurivora]|uniref:Mid2 domain-containing protein n=1 Tax=Plectosphaerella plurivora TaxID=936078 RepID=A0A9P8VBV1_9PEZI|nr:hypothetical protein F5X68DRAFT_209572 [Plectosphaerella plurivora]
MQPPKNSRMRLRRPQPPPSTGQGLAYVCLVAMAGLAEAHAYPRQTTVDFHILDVQPYPPAPTTFPQPADGPRRRQADDFNTICGYIGGDPGLPATCSAGSHCVVDTHVGAIGCCPNNGICTSGVFTSCVDANSGPQLEVNPYVFTCGGSDVCYRNQFEGGNFQYGCGSASNMAATVAPTASGLSAARPVVVSVSAPMDQAPSTLSAPTTLGSITRASQSSESGTTTASGSSTGSTTEASTESSTESSTSDTTSQASSTTSSGSSSSTNVSAESATPDPSSAASGDAPDASGGGGVNKKGAIIGGAISGAAILIGLILVAFFWKKKRQGNERKGPGAGGTKRYISPPMTNGQGRGFTPIASNLDPYDQGYQPGPHGTTTTILGGKAFADPGRHPAVSSTEVGQPYAYAYGPGGEVIPMQEPGRRSDFGDTSDDRVPLNHEYGDFSRGFSDALSRIEEEESRPASAVVNNHGMGTYGTGAGYGAGVGEPASPPATGSYSPRGGGQGGPLWQQNRRQSRNMMWMQQSP